MFDLQAYSWTLKLGCLGGCLQDLVTKPFEIPPTRGSIDEKPLSGATLNVDRYGAFELKLGAGLSHLPEAKWLLMYATCGVWSLDRTTEHHVHHFVTHYRNRSTLDLSWTVRAVEDALRNSGKSISFLVVLEFDTTEISVEALIRENLEQKVSKIKLAVEEHVKQDPQQRYKTVVQPSSTRALTGVQGEYIDLGSSAHPFDVRFIFGGEGESDEKELWENAAFLASRSPYFAVLFSSGYSESLIEPVSPQECKVASRTVRITEGTFEDYRATFIWLRTGHILLSDLLESSRSKMTDFTSEDAPQPVLARSIYAVAHYLQISSLCELALRCIEDCLTPTTAAEYLVDEWCYFYPEPRELVMTYAVDNWDKVKPTTVMKDAIAKRAKGELSPGARETLLDVLMRVACV
ncbi:BZ3500_MvSof-1268-A1-R1_Chr3-1g06127 [Microbotryum saponariae]|uniref:BZ3500_MvSof-1268-A1-R1_Chr3-1g06127 protein n=1 Tax=Microbotryum saponariae TaxID=289078 RepID=A0A2X0LFX1_9BASI|nr:BZ3500_MvSof-1268-A1-R1_Chr3-1g06127 [Microbotryum saponariae]SDA03990.1 BZ3501_MvSof-1269-A2-R1_Chr3-2g05812 [Microbotryum saponariae]